MNNKHIEIFKKIIDASQNNSLVFFVGAGISQISKAPGWKELIEYFCKQMKKGMENNRDEYLKISQIFYHYLNEDNDKYYEHINKILNIENLEPNYIHKLLFDFKPKAFVTTNFDDLLEMSAVENCQTFNSIACDNEISSINGEKFILKVHGDLKHKNIVLKEEDYLNYSENFKLTETLLKSIFATNTVVFIGYGLGDYNIKLIMNWTKSSLKEKFNNPFFIYTDDQILDENEIKYQKSRGLFVIDYHDYIDENTKNNEFIDRYKCVLNAIKFYSKFSLKNKNKIEMFNILYDLLMPLDKLNALRFSDIREKLQSDKDIYIDEVGIIIFFDNKVPNLMKYFYEINSMSYEEQEKLPKEIFNKYQIIVSVLSKARIKYIYLNNTYVEIKNIKYLNINRECIQFNYKSMHNYVNNSYQNSYSLYKKAYYLTKLKYYDQAYNLFVKVAIESFKDKNYILYYLAQTNRKILLELMSNINNNIFIKFKYNFKNLKGREIDKNKLETIFEDIPMEFQFQYKNFRNLISLNILFENSYYSFIYGEKLQKSIKNNTYEFGITSLDKAIEKINENLCFFINNGLCIEEYNEFRNFMKPLMSSILESYIITRQEKLSLTPLDLIKKKHILHLDEKDFYCFVKYFKSKEIIELFKINKVKFLEFADITSINISILNLIEYYDFLRKSGNFRGIHEEYEYEIKNCLVLLRYIRINQKIVDKIVEFIFKYEFRNILIDEKILFIEYQLYTQKMYSNITAKIIREKLDFYINKHMNAIRNNKNFKLNSYYKFINYFSLINYISENKEDINIEPLLSNVYYILINSDKEFSLSSLDSYYEYLSQYQKRKVINWIKNELKIKFNFEKCYFLISKNIPIDDFIFSQLKKFLSNEINKDKQEISFPDPIESIGCLFLNNCLDRKDFNDFVGKGCKKFDFYYQYENFDFKEFDIKWLFNLNEYGMESLFKNSKVKEHIKKILIEKIKSENLINTDKQYLTDILIKYLI